MSTFKDKAQAILLEYNDHEYKYHRQDLFDEYGKSLRQAIKIRATARYSLYCESKKVARLSLEHFLEDTENNDSKDKVNIDETTGYAFLLILTGPASTTLTHWGEFDSQSDMLLQLSKNLKIPSIIKDQSNKTLSSSSVKSAT